MMPASPHWDRCLADIKRYAGELYRKGFCEDEVSARLRVYLSNPEIPVTWVLTLHEVGVSMKWDPTVRSLSSYRSSAKAIFHGGEVR